MENEKFYAPEHIKQEARRALAHELETLAEITLTDETKEILRGHAKSIKENSFTVETLDSALHHLLSATPHSPEFINTQEQIGALTEEVSTDVDFTLITRHLYKHAFKEQIPEGEIARADLERLRNEFNTPMKLEGLMDNFTMNLNATNALEILDVFHKSGADYLTLLFGPEIMHYWLTLKPQELGRKM